MKLKIISTGDPLETHVVNAETGERLDGVSAISIECSPTGSRAHIQLVGYELVFTADFEKRSALL